MKAMKNLLKSAFALIILLGFASCNNFLSNKEIKDVDKNASEMSKTTLTINVEDSLSARTIYPDASVNFLSNFTITGSKSGDTINKTWGPIENYNKLKAYIIEFEDGEEGSWTFTMSASYTIGTDENAQTVTFTGTVTNQTITKNTKNTVTFKLQAQTFNYGVRSCESVV